MVFRNERERSFAASVSKLNYSNPFLPERIDFEKEILGEGFEPFDSVWNLKPDQEDEHSNLRRIMLRVDSLISKVHERFSEGEKFENEGDKNLYEDLILFYLYHRYRTQFDEIINFAFDKNSGLRKVAFWENFIDDYKRLLNCIKSEKQLIDEAAHLFAGFYQIRRCFNLTFRFIIGRSKPIALLRAQIWQSVLTHNMKRYRRVLFDKMHDIATMITGPSGTGKELVARAIGMSRYIPFNSKDEKFTGDFRDTFFPLHLSAMSPTLIESELFGHKRGAFTGALQDKIGWMEACPKIGSVFLDEIGEINIEIQVKLLRVLQSRVFYRLGDIEPQAFEGKIITATNRDLGLEIQEKRFREDLFYRLCSDRIETPSLHEQISDCPESLNNLIVHIARNLTDDAEGELLAKEVQEFVDKNLGSEYTWPGNVRELEQCVRNILIRKNYQPPSLSAANRSKDSISDLLNTGELSMDELMSHYCSLVYAQTNSYQESARKLGVDHRTVKAKISAELIERYQKK